MDRISPDARTCGGCTACCKWLQVKEIKKPEGEWCTHCDIGKGCRIYGSRPKDCRGFMCVWRAGFGDESQRPDASHCILTEQKLDIFGRGLVVVEMRDGAADRSRFVAEMKRIALGSGMPVWIRRFKAQDALFIVESFVIPEERLAILQKDHVRVFRYSVLSTTELGG